MDSAFMEGPDEWGRYTITGVEYDDELSSKLYDAGYEAINIPDGYLITPSIASDRSRHSAAIGAVLGIEVRFLRLVSPTQNDEILQDSQEP